MNAMIQMRRYYISRRHWMCSWPQYTIIDYKSQSIEPETTPLWLRQTDAVIVAQKSENLHFFPVKNPDEKMYSAYI